MNNDNPLFEEFKNPTTGKYEAKVPVYPNTQFPKPSKDDPDFSGDVFIIDEDDMHGLAFYSFKEKRWNFHTDTLVDYNEPGNETKWVWYYPPITHYNDDIRLGICPDCSCLRLKSARK